MTKDLKPQVREACSGRLRVERAPSWCFALLKYRLQTTFNGEARYVYEMAFSPKDLVTGNERVTPSEAHKLIEECDLVEMVHGKDGTLWDFPDRRFFLKYGKL
jgi:hypothetical protein